VEKTDSTPFLVRAFLPFIKKFVGRKKNGEDPGMIMMSPYYRIYQKYLYPIEYWITRTMPSLFAFRIILVARKIK